jgi:DNA primase
VYLCEGVVDTLTLLCRNISAVGIPGVSSFKTEWVPLFKGKNVIISFDKDEAGRNGALVVQELLSVAGIHNVIGGNLKLPEMFRMKEGNDINDFFGGRK